MNNKRFALLLLIFSLLCPGSAFGQCDVVLKNLKTRGEVSHLTTLANCPAPIPEALLDVIEDQIFLYAQSSDSDKAKNAKNAEKLRGLEVLLGEIFAQYQNGGDEYRRLGIAGYLARKLQEDPRLQQLKTLLQPSPLPQLDDIDAIRNLLRDVAAKLATLPTIPDPSPEPGESIPPYCPVKPPIVNRPTDAVFTIIVLMITIIAIVNYKLSAKQEAAARQIKDAFTMRDDLKNELQRIKERVTKIETQFQSPSPVPTPGPENSSDVKRSQNEIEELKKRLNGMSTEIVALQYQRSPFPDFPAFRREIEMLLKKEIDLLDARLTRQIEESSRVTKSQQSPRGARGVELKILSAAWSSYTGTSKTAANLNKAFEEYKTWRDTRNELLVNLANALGSNGELRTSFETVTSPVREFEALIEKMSLAMKLGELDPLPDEAKDLLRIRECTQLILMLQHTDRGAEKLGFRLEKWVREQFVGFADLFLRAYQEAEAEGTGGNLAEASAIVLKVLAAAGLEPIEIKLGRTLFNSNHHIGRSTASRTDMPDGSIVSVVKNGFRQIGGSVVIQPEVIVNRL